MTNLNLRWPTVIGFAICAAFTSATIARAQVASPGGFGDNGFSIVGAFDDEAGADPVSFSSVFTMPSADRPALVAITARIEPGWHVYSLTQPPGGPQKTTIEVEPSPAYKLLAPFRAQPEAKKRIDNEIWVGLEIQEHADEVTWYAPIELAEGVDPAKLEIRGTIDLQVCNESCIPIQQPFIAALGQLIDLELPTTAPTNQSAIRNPQSEIAPLSGPTFEGSYSAEDSEIQISGRIIPGLTRPGDGARLQLTATPTGNWHVYAHAPRDDKPGSKPTLIAFESTSGLKVGKPATDAPITEEDMSNIGFGVLRFHQGPVTWTVDIEVPDDAKAGDYTIAGIIGYQACESSGAGLGSCELPKAARFRGTLTVGDVPGSTAHPLTFAAASYSDAAKAAAAEPFLGPLSPTARSSAADAASEPSVSLVAILGFALLGGLILNVMPCVLPVIGLKIMAFAEQGGESRRHIFTLNLAYAAGLIGVFLVLATLASLTQLGLANESFGWGELYTLVSFKVAMTSLVFAMALSFLGVWEIPIPGFAGSGTAARLATQEGYSGAVFKGIFTTILATPCSGPFLGPVFGYTLAQPAWVTYLIFLFVGIGMAAPYLIIGAFPSLIHKLPRPGAWMETLKQLMGFVLLGTVVYLFSTIGEEYFIATLTLLVGIWFACWWIGRTPLTASDNARYSAWFGGVGAAALVGWGAFAMLTPSEYELPWQPYSPAALAQARAEGKTVLVDFTADWCPTCKTNLKFSLNREEVHELVKKNGVVALVADWTSRSPMIKQALAELGSRSIPLLAIYPADSEREVIVLPDLVTSGQVIEALEAAGPSRPAASTMATNP
jgi:suppressor for copper-sensitivity B